MFIENWAVILLLESETDMRPIMAYFGHLCKSPALVLFSDLELSFKSFVKCSFSRSSVNGMNGSSLSVHQDFSSICLLHLMTNSNRIQDATFLLVFSSLVERLYMLVIFPFASFWSQSPALSVPD